VAKFNFSLGILLIFCIIWQPFCWLVFSILVDLGMYCLISPFPFSMPPFCHKHVHGDGGRTAWKMFASFCGARKGFVLPVQQEAADTGPVTNKFFPMFGKLERIGQFSYTLDSLFHGLRVLLNEVALVVLFCVSFFAPVDCVRHSFFLFILWLLNQLKAVARRFSMHAWKMFTSFSCAP
jgi:hypothetical protein